ncbi:MAG: DUF2341 domain-containing protein [Patescibacteria group bacterium]
MPRKIFILLCALITCVIFSRPHHTSAQSLTGAINHTYTYSASTTDPEGDALYYTFNWGDGTPETRSPASGTVASGATVTAAHSWSSEGVYSVYVVACDPTQCSLQSDPSVITIAPPSTPGTPAITAGTNPSTTGTFTLGWTPSDPHSMSSVPVSISQYDVYRQLNGGGYSLVGSVTSPSYSETSLPDGTYDYYTIARDDTVPTNVSDPSGTYQVVVSLSGGGTPPTAEFDLCTLKSDTVQYQDLSTDDGTITAWSWDLGDTTTSNVQHPYHTYTPASWWNTSWTRRRKITFDNAAQAENLVNVPVLVKLNSTRIDYANTQNSGQDLRFLDTDGSTVLSYEIERWDESGNSFVWVKVPQINASSNTDYIWMYYGNVSALAGQNPTAVWDTNYRMVWHMNDASGRIQDSTSNNIDSTSESGMTYTTTGQIGLGKGLTSAGYIRRTTAATIQQDPFTWEVWFEADSFPSNTWFWEMNADNFSVKVKDGNTIETKHDTLTPTSSLSPVTTFTTNSWYHIVVVKSTTNVTVYRNGTQLHQYNLSGTPPWGDWNFGYNNFAGTLDEVRIASGTRSTNWIAAQYKSMTDTFNSFGSEELQGPGGPYNVTLTATDNESNPSTPTSHTVNLTTAPTCASFFTLTSAVATKCDEVGLTWTAAKAAQSYSIYRNDGAGWVQRFSGITGLFTYDTTVSPNSSYQYYIKAVLPSAGTLNNSTSAPACTGTWSGDPPEVICPLSVTTPSCMVVVDPLSPTSACGFITLSWQALDGATSYRVYRNVAVDNFASATQIASGLTTLSYTDRDIVPDVIYFYYVTSQTGANPSPGQSSKSICFRGSQWQER